MDSSGQHRLDVRLDEETYTALRRLAAAEDRSCAAQIRHLIRSDAIRSGLWTPTRPQIVRSTA